MNCRTISCLLAVFVILPATLACECATEHWHSCGFWNTCKACSTCHGGCHIDEGWVADILDECVPCGSGTFAHDGNDWTSCQSWKTCDPGTYVSVSPSSSNDRECAACSEGTESTEINAESCSDINGCAGHLCNSQGDTSAQCRDNAAPSTGYTCLCSNGYHDLDGACTDVNACDGHTCASGGDIDAQCRELPDSGYVCECSSGFEEIGSICERVDPCASNPCADNGDSDAACHPLESSSTTGNTCTCSNLFESVSDGDVTTCRARDLCASYPCATNGDSGASCLFDAFDPATGHTCVCTEGYVESQGTCVDFNACTHAAMANPCAMEGDTGSVCVDLSPPSSEYSCTCSNGFEFDAGVRTCVDVDGCEQFSSASTDPCASVDGDAKCEDVIGEHAPGADAYRCVCSEGFVGKLCEYSDETTCEGHGTVSEDGTCSCRSCFSGDRCDRCASTCASFTYPNCTATSPAFNGDSEDSDGPSSGAVAGIVVLVVVILALVGISAIYLSRRAGNPTRTFKHSALYEDDIVFDAIDERSAYNAPEVDDYTDGDGPEGVPFGEKRVVITKQDFIAL